MDKMKKISQEICEKNNCFFGILTEKNEEIVRCIKRDWVSCPFQKEINKINDEIEIILYN